MQAFRLVFIFLLQEAASQCLNNNEHGVYSAWSENGMWKINGYIKPDFEEKLKDWRLEIEFSAPLVADIGAWIVHGMDGTNGKSSVVLTAKSYNQIINENNFRLSYIVSFASPQGSDHLKCVQFCGTLLDSNQKLCSGGTIATTPSIITATANPEPVTTTTTVKPEPVTTTTTAKPKPVTTTTTANPGPVTTTTTTTTTANPEPVTTTTNPSACNPKYNYNEVLGKSILFYEAQRSGKLPPDQRVKWRKDSALQDGSDVQKDLSGGYYDAGDYVKFGFPMASAVTNLAWGMIEFKDGYSNAGQYKYGLQTLKWATDYFLKCHTSKYEFYGQVGDGDIDHAFWGRPEDMTMSRPSFKIDQSNGGSELAGETAAALAASSIAFKVSGNLAYAKLLLEHAETLYEFADKYKKSYSVSMPAAAKFYRSYSGYNDELAWACLWLFKATGNIAYKKTFVNNYDSAAYNGNIQEFSWDNKWAGVNVLAARLKITPKDYLNKLKTLLSSPKKTPKGLFFVQKWGANRHAANLAFLALIAAKIDDASFYENFARGQIHYMLGDAGRSFVVGFGNNPPKRPHHASSSCPTTGTCDWNTFNSPAPNAHVLYGALVGGPDQNDQYEDRRNDYVKNEVALDYNAGFQGAIAGLVKLAEEGKC